MSFTSHYFQMEMKTNLIFPKFDVFESYKAKHEYRKAQHGKENLFELLALLYEVNWMFYNAVHVYKETFKQFDRTGRLKDKRYIGLYVDDLENTFKPVREVFL
jgi:hypothetical protein